MENPRLIDLTGQRFGRLIVLHRAEVERSKTNAAWRCVCDCGEERTVDGYDLRKGKTSSCGCGRIGRRRTHGMTDTRLYQTWTNMLTRCLNPKVRAFKHYGGRGITMCPAWRDFTNFAAWAASSGYRDDLTIERINVDDDYSPDNCTWATMSAQRVNRRDTARAPDGRPWSVIGRENGVSAASFYARRRRGWSHQRAATEPIDVASRKRDYGRHRPGG